MIIKSEDSFPWHTLYISYNSILWLIYDTYHPQARDRNSTYGEATINSVGITDYNPYYDSWKILLFYQNVGKYLLGYLLLILLVSLSESRTKIMEIKEYFDETSSIWYFAFYISFFRQNCRRESYDSCSLRTISFWHRGFSYFHPLSTLLVKIFG